MKKEKLEIKMWVHFEFSNGSNPYIALRSDTFFYMICKYFVYQVSEFGFKAYEEREVNTAKRNPFTREIKKAILRSFAQDWQRSFDCFNYSTMELLTWQSFFEVYGRRYGLIREFKENGIL